MNKDLQAKLDAFDAYFVLNGEGLVLTMTIPAEKRLDGKSYERRHISTVIDSKLLTTTNDPFEVMEKALQELITKLNDLKISMYG